jgi:hypothetical protein
MTKKKVLEGLRRVIEGNTGKTSEVVREFKQCPQFQQCCHILSQALQHNTYGRKRSATKAPSGLIARGRSLDVPRLDSVALHHSSFGSDAASARFATVLVELGIANLSDWKASAGEPAKFLRRTLDRFVRSHGESEIDEAFELSVALSTDPHEWCESEDEPDASQMFLYVEASSCGFVNLGPALAFL